MLSREKQLKGFVNPFHLKNALKNQYIVILIYHNPINPNSELKLVGKYNQYIAPVYINNFSRQMAIKYGEHIRQFNFKVEVFSNVRYEKYSEDASMEINNHHILIETLSNLTRLELNDLDVMTRLDREMQRREMQGSGWNLQGNNYLKKISTKLML